MKAGRLPEKKPLPAAWGVISRFVLIPLGLIKLLKLTKTV
jgi:hypothetical protein